MGRRATAMAVLALALAGAHAQAEDLVYVEALGKAGAYGVGYEYGFSHHLAVGVAASFVTVSDQQIYTAAPYLHATLLAGTRHALFSELGAVLAHSRIPSPVDDWDGMTDTGAGGYLSLGWEYQRGPIVMRTSGSLVVGEGGAGPMIGFLIGLKP